jgi:hypothetical protein
MKKLLLALFVAFGLQTQAQLWNVQLDVDPIVSFSPASGLAGVMWTGSEFWVSKWADNNIYTADALGNMTGNFTIPGITGTRSMTTDGNYIYIGTAAAAIYQVDPITKTLISTINTSVPACRYLTFDSGLDNGNGGFWTGAYGSDILSVSMTGTTLSTISAATHGLGAIYGMAYDGYSTGGPYLWAFDQGGNGADIIQLNMTGIPTGISHDATAGLGTGTGGLAGGLFVCNNFITGTNSMIGLSQGVSLFSYELGDPPLDDPILESLNIASYVVNPSNVNIEGTIRNGGLNLITSIDVKWSDGTNTYTDNLTGLNISSNQTYNFTHNTQLSISNNNSNSITVWIEYAADLNTTNNTLNTAVAGVTYIPTKRVVFEEATGTWCGWCPRGAVGLETLEQSYPNTAIGIAVHNGDAMTVTAYDAGMNVGGYPSGHVDRSILDVDPGDFIQYYGDRINEISPVQISATAVFDPSTRMIDINLSGEFVANLSGDYRFNAVILEDEVGPYSQANYYSGGGAGPLVSPISGFDWAAASNPVSVTYDHVARAILGGFDGTAGSLPVTITAGGIHTHNYTHTLPANQNESKVHVAGMIIDNSTGEILNGVKVELSGFTPASWDCNPVQGCYDPGTGSGQYTSLTNCQASCIVNGINEEASEIRIYPNPVKDRLVIEGEYTSLNIYDVFGKLVLSAEAAKAINVSSLSSGVYMLNINTEKGTATQKITITK